MAALALAAAALAVLVLVVRQWNDFSSNDFGYMSPKWLAEYNAQHP